MKIGIITLSGSDNCGSLLQAYALQKVLKEYAEYVEIINFKTKKAKKLYRIVHPSYFRHPRKIIGTVLQFKKLKKQQKEYEAFRNKYLRLSACKYRSSVELTQISINYDVIITGSDQVWNTEMADFDSAFLLNWCGNQKRIAYAASLGDKKKGSISGLLAHAGELEKYSAISVREESARDELGKALKREICVTLDPTLLLTQDQWNKIVPQRSVNDKYIFYYSYNYTDNVKNEMVYDFAKRKGLPVYVINISRWLDGKNKDYGFHIFAKSGPLAFLELMKYSECSLVESYHGTIFSYIFKKQFWFLKNSNDNNLDGRINDILSVLELKDRVLHPEDLKSDRIDHIKIFSDKTVFKKMLVYSMEYLKNAVKQ